MAVFEYIAVNPGGQRVPGQVDAASRADALKALAADAVVPLRLRQSRAVRQVKLRISRSTLAAAFSMLSDQVEAGVPLLNALRNLATQTKDPSLKHVLKTITDRVADGSTLQAAMLEFPTVFHSLDCCVVHAGEEGGFLHEALARLATLRERQEELRRSVISALAYPLLVSAAGILTVSAMLIFFVPQFEPLFENLRAEGRMPLPTTLLLALSAGFQSWGLPVGLILFALGYTAWKLIPSEQRRQFCDRTILKIRMAGPLVSTLGIARFCRILGTLLQNGVPVMASMHIAKGATGNSVLANNIGEAAESVGSGKSISGPLSRGGLFPNDVIEMLNIAEQTNRLDTVLLQVSEKLELRARNQLSLLVRMIEPVMMLCLAVIVGFLVIALLMPVFEGNGLT